MYANVRINSYSSAKLGQGHDQLEEFQAVHARQPGYHGSILVDLGDGRQLAVNLWDSEEHAIAALPAMAPEVQRLVEPLLAAPSQFIGAGPARLIDFRGAGV